MPGWGRAQCWLPRRPGPGRPASWLGGAATEATTTATLYETPRASVVHPVLVAANRMQIMSLTTANLLGLNFPAIAALDALAAQYEQMWAQGVAAMAAYHGGASTVAAQLSPWQQALGTRGNNGVGNVGVGNTGNTNLGSGGFNTGFWNLGGPFNVGFANIGYHDIGVLNSATNAGASYTSGVANSGDGSSGAFNTSNGQSGFFG